jgi:adenylosuccinate synthase
MKKEKEAVIVVDLGFGDAGKGTMIDWLGRTRAAHTVVRFNGGGQAGHNVITSDGRHHTFSQFGSATFVPGVRTHHSRFMLVNPLAMMQEERVLRTKGVTDAFARTTISAEAPVVTIFQRAANRLRELGRGDGRHGSCGMGIGETMADMRDRPDLTVRVGDLLVGGDDLAGKLARVQEYKPSQMREAIRHCRERGIGAEEIGSLEDGRTVGTYLDAFGEFVRRAVIVEDGYLGHLLAEPGVVLFEGAQGVLLDEVRGFHPYTTWSNCTFGNALFLLAEHRYDGDLTRLGVVRAYATRHGPGPFVTEDAALGKLLPDMHNRMDDWQRNFRVGWFDAVATRYAVAACGGADALAVTCVDRMARQATEWRICDAYAFDIDGDDPVRHFERSMSRFGYLASDIRLGPDRDLTHQEALTRFLLDAKPVYGGPAHAAGNALRWVDDHLDRIASTVGVPIRALSFGPTADDKRSRG